jgi:type IV secretory pathway TraG/TraD family ATPase VirD4
LYLIGREGSCRALIGALTAEVAHQVRMTAAGRPGGRLDPPMTALLDEAPLTCGPIPLHDWTSDMGGRGLTLHVVAQSLAQLRDVWGHDRANTILGNTASLLVFGGLKAADDLDRLSTLTGTRLVQLEEDDRRPVPVMTPAEIASLPSGTALLIRNGMRPVIGKAPMIWQRKPPITERTTRALTPPAWLRAGVARVAGDLAGAVREVVTEIRLQRAKAIAKREAERVGSDTRIGS